MKTHVLAQRKSQQPAELAGEILIAAGWFHSSPRRRYRALGTDIHAMVRDDTVRFYRRGLRPWDERRKDLVEVPVTAYGEICRLAFELVSGTDILPVRSC